MPKRNNEKKIERYKQKIRKMEQEQRKYNRIIYSSSEDSDKDSDHETNGNVPEPVDVLENGTNDVLDTEEPSQEPVTVPELDPETLSALGETTEEAPKFGANIHESLSRLWLPILRKGINKETKEKLAKEYLVPENCALLQPPKLNPEISSAVNEGARARDKKVEAVQQQLGLGITALNKG
ncbi:uncharacterized protein LOC119691941 [Plutella xylostella]|nr:uncharacterized protein LOC119691941 [Plutella xylostella]